MSMTQILRLKPAFTDEQAQALAGLFDEEIATKRDVAVLGTEVEKFRIEIKADLDRVRSELKADTDKLRLEVQRDLKATEARLVGWVVGQGIATIGILFALLHFIGK